MTRYLFENPWPLAILFAAIGVVLAWRALSAGDGRALPLAAVSGAAALLTFAADAIVTTSGEHATEVVEQFVTRAETGDVPGMMALLSRQAGLNYGRPENPTAGMEEIASALRTLEGRYRIRENTVTQLDAVSDSSTTATVLLSCRTVVSASDGQPVRTSWILRVRRDTDGVWRIDRITFARLEGREPSPTVWR